MGLKDRVLNRIGVVTETEASSRALESYKAGLADAEDEPPSGSLAKYGYRRAGGGQLRDFSKLDPDSILENVWTVYQSNPIAARALEIKRDYIVGRGIQIMADNSKLQEILDNFWADNKMPQRAREFTLQLFLLGSQIYPVFVRESDGRVRIGYIDPGEVEKVIVHPENALEPWAIIVKPQQAGIEGWATNYGKRAFRIIRKDEGAVRYGEEINKVVPANHEGKLVTAEQAVLEDWEYIMLTAQGLQEYSGSCFYTKVNSVSNQERGWSDLLQLLDWADQHDETLFALADREQMAGYFAWIVKLTGASPKEVEKRRAELKAKPPKKGSVLVCNEAEEWKFEYPDIKQAGSIETANALLTFILGGLGLPRHWYGYGDETNRATAQAQGDPTWRSMEHDQDLVKQMFLIMLEFVRDQAEIANYWKAEEDEEGNEQRGIDIVMPEMTSKDMGALLASFANTVVALVTALQSKLVTREKALEVLGKVLAEIDVEVNSLEELEALDAEAEQDELQAQATRSSWFGQHGPLATEEELWLPQSKPILKSQ